jgi:hypothetical protein
MNLHAKLAELQTIFKRLTYCPITLMPKKRVALRDLTIELWVSRRKLPLVLRAHSIVVPTGPDLKMVFGIAKMVRDMGADVVQYEANRVAPLAPGEAFVGTGARFRYKFTALAVIFDESKRTSQALISKAVSNAMLLLRDHGAKSVVVPDMTENLLTQPNWITEEQRRETAAITARLMIEAILSAGSNVKMVKIWVWDPDNAQFFIDEMEQIKKRRQAVPA